MGALHAGHRALIDRARSECDRIVVSIFVNPLQFGPTEDFNHYPQRFTQDAELCERAGVDILYHGTVADVYPPDFRTTVSVRELTEGMCGPHRPGHFDGVTTVVAKLLLRTVPDVAYFGQKDYQQALVIKRMARDLDLPAEIRLVATVRDENGLALSSRNEYLTEQERTAATCLWRGLSTAAHRYAQGERRAGPLRGACRRVIDAEPLVRLQYVAVADADSLRFHEDDEAVGDRTVIAVAATVGGARLIDNVILQSR
jgi:pantoate--beta-alanine ligase